MLERVASSPWGLPAAAAVVLAFYALLLWDGRRVGLDRALGHLAVWVTLAVAALAASAIRGTMTSTGTVVGIAGTYGVVTLLAVGRPGLLIHAVDDEADRSELTRGERALIRWVPWMSAAVVAGGAPYVTDPGLFGSG